MGFKCKYVHDHVEFNIMVEDWVIELLNSQVFRKVGDTPLFNAGNFTRIGCLEDFFSSMNMRMKFLTLLRRKVREDDADGEEVFTIELDKVVGYPSFVNTEEYELPFEIETDVRHLGLYKLVKMIKLNSRFRAPHCKFISLMCILEQKGDWKWDVQITYMHPGTEYPEIPDGELLQNYLFFSPNHPGYVSPGYRGEVKRGKIENNQQRSYPPQTDSSVPRESGTLPQSRYRRLR